MTDHIVVSDVADPGVGSAPLHPPELFNVPVQSRTVVSEQEHRRSEAVQAQIDIAAGR